ncbi:MAG TPA: hypothetical protein VM938_04260 [Acidimicrobiales bacterium]|nr:hypothetical protein [Acidimicrobiales bacterium]
MPDDDVNEVDLEQQPVGPGGEAGGGEWPDPDAPPTGPAPGESPRSDAPADPVGGDGTDTQAEVQQDGSTGGDRGEARLGEGPAGFKDVLEADPVRGGSASTPHDDIPEDRESSPDPSAGGP